MLGWAVPESWFRPLAEASWPEAEHVCFDATADGRERWRAAAPCDWTVGYSLGSLLLLEESARLGGRVALLAPIFALPSEEGLGGRVSRTQVRQLARRLRRDPRAALGDFYRWAGLGIPLDDSLPPTTVLEWGLERLAQGRVRPPLPGGWRGWCGEADPLLDAGRLHQLAPAVAVVPGAGHHPGALIGAFVRDVNS